MSHPLVQAQAEKTDLEQALAWLRGEGSQSGRREAEIAARAVERGLAEIKQRLSGELSETAGYVIFSCSSGGRVFTAVPGDMWSSDLRTAERFFDRPTAEQRLATLKAAFPRCDRWKLSVEPLAKLMHRSSGKSLAPSAPTTQPTQGAPS